MELLLGQLDKVYTDRDWNKLPLNIRKLKIALNKITKGTWITDNEKIIRTDAIAFEVIADLRPKSDRKVAKILKRYNAEQAKVVNDGFNTPPAELDNLKEISQVEKAQHEITEQMAKPIRTCANPECNMDMTNERSNKKYCGTKCKTKINNANKPIRKAGKVPVKDIPKIIEETEVITPRAKEENIIDEIPVVKPEVQEVLPLPPDPEDKPLPELNTVSKVMWAYGGSKGDSEGLAKFIYNNYEKITGQPFTSFDDMAESQDIADIVAFYKIDTDTWEEDFNAANSQAQPKEKKPDSKKSANRMAFNINQEVEAFLDANNPPYTPAQIAFISQHSGYGGLDEFIAFEDVDRKILFEYFTPEPIVEKMWSLAYHYGYKGGPVLEPSAGTGAMLQFAPTNAKITAYEINPYTAKILQARYPNAKVEVGKFESMFIKGRKSIGKKTDSLPHYDLVIGNPPFGRFGGTEAQWEKKATNNPSNYIDYFITRSLDVLNPGGLLVFIVGVEVAAGGKPFLERPNTGAKKAITEKSTLIDAYRLPNGVFDRTDVLSDIIVLRKK